jgi:hypothetical protein
MCEVLMPKCELCDDFDPPKAGVGSIGWCRKYGIAVMISGSCREGERQESDER